MSDRNDENFREKLDDEQFRVARCGGTEPAFSGKYWNHKEKGIYTCVCCGEPLFASTTKYDSGSGWPSFYAAIDDEAIAETVDRSHGMVRTEVACARCGAHLGHLFPDGPKPTGLRYCVNSASLDFQPAEA